MRVEIAREMDRNRNQRLQRKASPPRAQPSLEFVTSENNAQAAMTAGRPLSPVINMGVGLGSGIWPSSDELLLENNVF